MMNIRADDAIDENQSLVKSKTSSSRNPQDYIARSLLPFTLMLGVLILAQFTDKLLPQSLEISNIIPQSGNLSKIFVIKISEIPKTFQYFESKLYFTSQSPPSKPFNVKILYNNTITRKNENITKQITLLRPNAFSTVVFSRSYTLSNLKNDIIYKIQNIPDEVTGYNFQIRGISLYTYYFSIIHTAFVIIALIILGFITIKSFLRKNINSCDVINPCFYASCIAYIFPYDLFNIPYIFIIKAFFTSFYPGLFAFLSFKILEDAGPLVPLPVIFKEWTTHKLSIFISVTWFLNGIFIEKVYSYVFYAIFIIVYLIYSYYIHALYKIMQCQQRRIEESYALWLRLLFLVISLLFFSRKVFYFIIIPYQIAKTIEMMSIWVTIGTVVASINILTISTNNTFINISYSKDDNKYLDSLFGSPDNSSQKYSKGTEQNTQEDLSAAKIVDGIFSKEYPEESFGGQQYMQNNQVYNNYPGMQYDYDYQNQNNYGPPMYEQEYYKDNNIQNQMYLQSLY